MTPETIELAKQIAELKAEIVRSNSNEPQKLTIVFWGIVGAVSGSIITVLLNLWKERIFFKKNSEKEERNRGLERAEKEIELIRRLSSKLFGINYSLVGNLRNYNHSMITHFCYLRLSQISPKDDHAFFIEQAKEFNNKADTNYDRVISNFQEYSEIVGEYLCLIPNSEVQKLYVDFISNDFHSKVDYSKCNSFEEAEEYRTKAVNDYSQKITNVLKKGFAIRDEMDKELKEKCAKI